MIAGAEVLSVAIQYSVDSYFARGPKIVGRRAANERFLAAIARHGRSRLGCFTASRDRFNQLRWTLEHEDPRRSDVFWADPRRVDDAPTPLQVFRSDPMLAGLASFRERFGRDRFSICGLTHTLSSNAIVAELRRFGVSGVCGHDALICTSNWAKAFVDDALRDSRCCARGSRPQTPVIPLGVDTGAVLRRSARALARAEVRRSFGADESAVVYICVGRLTSATKLHWSATFAVLESVARASSKPVWFVAAGAARSDADVVAIRALASSLAPRVRSVIVPNPDAKALRRLYCSADVFVSLADNPQETFGLTPLEAMANGLAVVVSDWSGYRDTVRDDIDGFLIRTWIGSHAAWRSVWELHELSEVSYDDVVGSMAAGVTVDHDAAVASLVRLGADPLLRQRLGESGAKRAAETYSWSTIIGRYEDLWLELSERRACMRRHRCSLRSRRPVDFTGLGVDRVVPAAIVEVPEDVTVEDVIHVARVSQADRWLAQWGGASVVLRTWWLCEYRGASSYSEIVRDTEREHSIQTPEAEVALAWLAKHGLVRMRAIGISGEGARRDQ